MKRNKKLITLILLSLLCLGLAITGSLAAFTKTNYVKRVVSTKAGSSDQWSSNYLQPLTSNTDPVVEQTYRLSGALALSITICNYPQGDMTKYSNSDIQFTLALSLKDNSGSDVIDTIGKAIKIKNGASTSGEGTPLSSYDQATTYTLSGGTPSTMLFSFTCAADAVQNLDNCVLTVKAVPKASGIKTLASAFRFTSTSDARTEWTGEFLQDLDSVSGLDALNYKLTGTAQGTITLTINTDVVQISRFSYQELKGSGNTSRFTFNVGGENMPTQYVLQFYWTNGRQNVNWDTMNTYVTAAFHEAPTE